MGKILRQPCNWLISELLLSWGSTYTRRRDTNIRCSAGVGGRSVYMCDHRPPSTGYPTPAIHSIRVYGADDNMYWCGGVSGSSMFYDEKVQTAMRGRICAGKRMFNDRTGQHAWDDSVLRCVVVHGDIDRLRKRVRRLGWPGGHEDDPYPSGDMILSSWAEGVVCLGWDPISPLYKEICNGMSRMFIFRYGTRRLLLLWDKDWSSL